MSEPVHRTLGLTDEEFEKIIDIKKVNHSEAIVLFTLLLRT